VGDYSGAPGGRQRNQALHWNGRNWTLVSTPQPSRKGSAHNGLGSYLFGIACPAASNCWAVGSYTNSARASRNQALHWNGRKWTLVSTPQPGGNDELTGVSCVSRSNCWAAGDYNNSSGADPDLDLNQALHWNGRRWTLVSTPQPGGNTDRRALRGVSCASRRRCWAVGSYQNKSGLGAMLNEGLRWNGRRWQHRPTPQPAGTHGMFHHNVLSGVSCVTRLNCWAIGYEGDISQSTLNQVLHWNRRQWRHVSTPQPGATKKFDFKQLLGVSCVSRSNCWAVGDYYNGSGADLNQALHWNGRKWRHVSTPQPGGTKKADLNSLDAVSCASRSNCWAVGSSAGRNEALHWNGSAWLTRTPI
jgi:hypothetical protein